MACVTSGVICLGCWGKNHRFLSLCLVLLPARFCSRSEKENKLGRIWEGHEEGQDLEQAAPLDLHPPSAFKISSQAGKKGRSWSGSGGPIPQPLPAPGQDACRGPPGAPPMASSPKCQGSTTPRCKKGLPALPTSPCRLPCWENQTHLLIYITLIAVIGRLASPSWGCGCVPRCGNAQRNARGENCSGGGDGDDWFVLCLGACAQRARRKPNISPSPSLIAG